MTRSIDERTFVSQPGGVCRPSLTVCRWKLAKADVFETFRNNPDGGFQKFAFNA